MQGSTQPIEKSIRIITSETCVAFISELYSIATIFKVSECGMVLK